MGVLKFLKKKKQVKPAGLTPISQHPDNLKKDLLKSENLPSMDEIPLPPKPEGQGEPASEDIPAPEATEEKMPAEEKIDMNESKPQEQTEFTDNTLEPDEPPEPEEVQDVPDKPKPASDTPTQGDTGDDFDFSLPDFSDEDLKISEESKKQEEQVEEQPEPEPKVESEPEEEPKSEEKEETEPEQETELEKEEEKSEEETEVSPLTKEITSETPVDKYFVSLNQCEFIFNRLLSNREIINETNEIIQKAESDKKELLEKFKLFHDSLDVAQEKLMKIDNALFER